MKSWEMVKLLMENQKRKAVDKNGYEISFCGGRLVDEEGEDACIEIYDDWTIIEPELEKLSFSQVMKRYLHSNPKINPMISIHTNNKYRDLASLICVTDNEIDSLWTIEE